LAFLDQPETSLSILPNTLDKGLAEAAWVAHAISPPLFFKKGNQGLCMNLPDESLSTRIVNLIESSKSCVDRVLDGMVTGVLDEDDTKGLIARLSVIDSRSMLLFACLNVDQIEADFSNINLDEEIKFIAASEHFITEITTILTENTSNE